MPIPLAQRTCSDAVVHELFDIDFSALMHSRNGLLTLLGGPGPRLLASPMLAPELAGPMLRNSRMAPRRAPLSWPRRGHKSP